MNQSNRKLAVAMQELRRSSAATPIPSGKRYTRKPKHSKRPDGDA